MDRQEFSQAFLLISQGNWEIPLISWLLPFVPVLVLFSQTTCQIYGYHHFLGLFLTFGGLLDLTIDVWEALFRIFAFHGSIVHVFFDRWSFRAIFNFSPSFRQFAVNEPFGIQEFFFCLYVFTKTWPCLNRKVGHTCDTSQLIRRNIHYGW